MKYFPFEYFLVISILDPVELIPVMKRDIYNLIKIKLVKYFNIKTKIS